jgi:hypothetical protein
MPASWLPTHRITFTPACGGEQTWLVMLVDDPERSERAAPTHGEWLSRTTPAWTRLAVGQWQWRHQRTPKGAAGEVSVDEVSGVHRIIGGARRAEAVPL